MLPAYILCQTKYSNNKQIKPPPPPFLLCMKHSLSCAFKIVYMYLYYLYVYCFTVLVTPCSSFYSHAPQFVK